MVSGTAESTWSGRPKTHYAVLECDEAALKQVVPLIHPKAVVVTNLFSQFLLEVETRYIYFHIWTSEHDVFTIVFEIFGIYEFHSIYTSYIG